MTLRPSVRASVAPIKVSDTGRNAEKDRSVSSMRARTSRPSNFSGGRHAGETAVPTLHFPFSIRRKATRHSARAIRAVLGTFACLAIVGSSTGCVRRTVTVNTDPQGALVHLNDQQIGTSPAKVDFTWYGDYDVVVRKDGYKTLKTNHRLDAPWYQVPPFDFVAEVLTPGWIHDEREMFFELEPAEPIDKEQLVEDAVEVRERTLFGSE